MSPPDRPFFYFKPVLIEGDKPHWAKGFNYLALASNQVPEDVYPHFFEEHGGLISDDLGFGLLATSCPVSYPPPHHLKSTTPGYTENRLSVTPCSTCTMILASSV